MAAPVTECAFITMKPGVDLQGSTPEAQVWQDTIVTLGAQDGYQRCYWGRQLEDPDVLMLLIDWDTLQSHKDFMAAPAYAPFVQNLTRIMQGVALYHVTPAQHPPARLLGSSPCIEYATFYACEPAFLGSVETFAAKLRAGAPSGFHEVGYGAVVEEIKKPGGEGEGKEGEEGKEGKAVVLWIGWDSKQVHMEFRESELFGEIIGLLRQGHGGVGMFHVSLTTQALVGSVAGTDTG